MKGGSNENFCNLPGEILFAGPNNSNFGKNIPVDLNFEDSKKGFVFGSDF